MNGHLDVNLPRELHGLAGCGLVVLYHDLCKQGLQPRYERKDTGPDAVKGNHIFDAWVYVKLSEHDNSEVVLGTTVHTAVITVVHF